MPTRSRPQTLEQRRRGARLVSRVESAHEDHNGRPYVSVTETWQCSDGSTFTMASFPPSRGEVTAAFEADRRAAEQSRIATTRANLMTYTTTPRILGPYSTRRPRSADEIKTEHGSGALSLLARVETELETIVEAVRTAVRSASEANDYTPQARQRMARERAQALLANVHREAANVANLIEHHRRHSARADEALAGRIKSVSVGEAMLLSDIRRELMALAPGERNKLVAQALSSPDELLPLAIASWPESMDRGALQCSGSYTGVSDRATIVATLRARVGGEAAKAADEIGRIGGCATAAVSRACQLIGEAVGDPRFAFENDGLTIARQQAGSYFGDGFSGVGSVAGVVGAQPTPIALPAAETAPPAAEPEPAQAAS